MFSQELLLLACLCLLLGGLSLTSTTTTTTFVAAMTIANQDLERYFRTANATHTLATMTEDRIAMDVYTYAFLNYSYFDGSNYHKISFNEEKARYGEGRIFNVHGKLVHISDVADRFDDYACGRNIMGTLGRPTPDNGVTWIALVRRGRCTFEEKVKNVHEKGASGVIIFNDKQVMTLEKMQIKGKNRNITAVITYQDIGTAMANILDNDHNVTVAITEGNSGMRPINSLNRTSVLFVSVSFIVLMIISLVWLIFYYIQRFRYLQAKDQQSRNLCSVTKKAIMKIPTKTGKSSDEKDADGDCCAICIECYKSSDIIRILPCKHEFHKNCIDPWLIEHRTCPMCKLDVLKFYGYVFLGSEESIVEIEVERTPSAVTATTATAVATTTDDLATNSTQPTQTHALSDLVQSRDFVIDFPRVFVLEGGSRTGTHETLFAARLPERSQSSLSLAHAKDWMNAVTNKLDEQHGLRRIQKSSRQYDMQENLLAVQRGDLFRKRRTRSADGRYSNNYFARLELQAEEQSANNAAIQNEGLSTPVAGKSNCNKVTLHKLTDASYAPSRRRQREEYNMSNTRRRSKRRDSDISLRTMQCADNGTILTGNHASNERHAISLAKDITIQINGEGIDMP